MRLTVRVLGLTLLDLEVSDTDDDVESLTAPPRTFGFHASGPGIVERADDTMLDTYDKRR